GMTFRMRRLMTDPEKQKLRVRALPKIEGFSDDPRKPIKPPDPRTPEERGLWTFDIRGIDASVRQIWFDETNYVGAGRVRGAFRFAPARSIEVLSSEVSLAGGDLGFGEMRPIASAV